MTGGSRRIPSRGSGGRFNDARANAAFVFHGMGTAILQEGDAPLLSAVSAKDVVWRNNRGSRNNRYRGWNRLAFEAVGCGRINVDGSEDPP